MAVTGSELQEKRLDRMGRLADEAIPGIGITVFKGMFRFAIKMTLEEFRIDSWEVMVPKDNATKLRFFEAMLKNASDHFSKSGLDQEQIETVTRILKETMGDDIAKSGNPG